MLLRAVFAAPLIGVGLHAASAPSPDVVEMVTAAAASLLFIGLWTPLAAALIAVLQFGVAWSTPANPWPFVYTGVLAAAIAMLGPGGCSIDARLFGRKQIQIPQG